MSNGRWTQPALRPIGLLAGLLLAALTSLGPTCSSDLPQPAIDSFDADTGYVEFSQTGYALLNGCSSGNAGSYQWELLAADGVTPLDVAFYDVGATVNPDNIPVDIRFHGTQRQHACWQSVDLHAAGVFDFDQPGPPPHGYVRLTVASTEGGSTRQVTHPFRIAQTAPQQIGMINSAGYITQMEKPYLRWFRGEEVVDDLLLHRSIDPSRVLWGVAWNLPDQPWAGSTEFYFEELSDGRNLQEAVAEAFDAVDAYNASAPAGQEIPRGWLAVDFGRIDLARKYDPNQCCVDDGTGNCDPLRSINNPTQDFLGCGGPYGSTGGPKHWCGVDGVGGVGRSTCHEADGSYGGLEGIPLPEGGVGQPDSLTVDRLAHVPKAFADYQDQLFGVLDPPCHSTDFRQYDRSWFCSAYADHRCLYGPDAGQLCSSASDCTLGICRPTVPLWYGHVSLRDGAVQPGYPYRCRNPYGYCSNQPTRTCEANSECSSGGVCILDQVQGHCVRVTNAPGLWDRRDPETRRHLIGMIAHTLEEAWNFRPHAGRDHFSVIFGGEGLLYYDRGTSCRGDRKGCSQLDHSDNTFAHKDNQYAYPDLGDLRVHYRNPMKPGEAEYFDSLFYEEFRDALMQRGFSEEAYVVYHGSKYHAPVSEVPSVKNRLWWMTEPARLSLRDDGHGNRVQSHPLTFPGPLNGRAPTPRADSMGYAFRSDRVVSLSARHNSVDDGKPTVGNDHAQGALWSTWMIDPADDPATNCPLARFGGTGAGTGGPDKGPGAYCTTQTPQCAMGPDGLCPESARHTCTVDPSDPAWGSCRNLVLNVFDYDNRTWGVCSENTNKGCTTNRDCTGTCQSRGSILATNVGARVSLVDLDAAALAAGGGLMEMDFAGPGCTDSNGINRATYVGDPTVTLCDAGAGLRDLQARAHVEVLDQASPAFDEGEIVVLEGTLQTVGGATPGSASGARLGFGFAAGEGWGPSASFDTSSRVVRSAATRNGPQLWFDGTDVFLGCGAKRFSGRLPVGDDAPHHFRIVWDRAQDKAWLDLDGKLRSCANDPVQGGVAGFVLAPIDSYATGALYAPYDIIWSDLSLHGATSAP